MSGQRTSTWCTKKKGKAKGDKYLNRIFSTLEYNIKEMIADRAEWLGLADEASEVFTKVSLLGVNPDSMDKGSLIAAQRGDFKACSIRLPSTPCACLCPDSRC